MRWIRLVVSIVVLVPALASAQWTNRFPAVDSFGHQVYLEGYELPILNAGPMDAAPSPAGDVVAFSSRGWIWSMDLESGVARRLTSAAGVDARPTWSSDGRRLVFVRDSGRRLAVVSLDLDDGEERVLVDTDAIHLDPVFTASGQSVVYASAEGGPLGLWRVDLESLEREPLTGVGSVPRRFIDRRPQIVSPNRLLVLHKQGARDALTVLDLETGAREVLVEDWITSQADLSLAPDGRLVAYTWPADGHHELRLLDLAEPSASVLLTRSEGMPLAPSFSHDGDWVYFSEADDDERMQLKRVRVGGGEVETLTIRRWDWGAPTGRVVVRTTIDGQAVPVRMAARDASGHPVVPESGAVRNEAQWDRVFYYSDGRIELVVPEGDVTVSAVHGLETPLAEGTVSVPGGGRVELTLELERLWDAAADGWYGADNHFHLNYGGPYRLEPEDIVLDMRGEAMHVGTPLLANLHNRFLEQDLADWRRDDLPILDFGQEVRSHFLGHVGLIGQSDLFWPWIWGPGYQVYARDDRPNAAPLRHAREHGGLGGYVHPVAGPDPFTEGTLQSIPVGFVADAVLGEIDLLEVACLWTDELGTAALWHEVLNLGIPLAASAGSDVMNDYYRTMAIGATRVYVQPQGPLGRASYYRALREGRSFVTNGPLLQFAVAGRGPGEAIENAAGDVPWTLEVASAVPTERVEIFVNGEVVQVLEGSPTPGRRSYEGTVEVPEGGWVSARVTGTNTGWPALDGTLYAQSSPIWFGAVGSTDPAASSRSAARLLEALAAARNQLVIGYGDAEIPVLLAHFEAARRKLEEMAPPATEADPGR